MDYWLEGRKYVTIFLLLILDNFFCRSLRAWVCIYNHPSSQSLQCNKNKTSSTNVVFIFKQVRCKWFEVCQTKFIIDDEISCLFDNLSFEDFNPAFRGVFINGLKIMFSRRIGESDDKARLVPLHLDSCALLQVNRLLLLLVLGVKVEVDHLVVEQRPIPLPRSEHPLLPPEPSKLVRACIEDLGRGDDASCRTQQVRSSFRPFLLWLVFWQTLIAVFLSDTNPFTCINRRIILWSCSPWYSGRFWPCLAVLITYIIWLVIHLFPHWRLRPPFSILLVSPSVPSSATTPTWASLPVWIFFCWSSWRWSRLLLSMVTTAASRCFHCWSFYMKNIFSTENNKVTDMWYAAIFAVAGVPFSINQLPTVIIVEWRSAPVDYWSYDCDSNLIRSNLIRHSWALSDFESVCNCWDF